MAINICFTSMNIQGEISRNPSSILGQFQLKCFLNVLSFRVKNKNVNIVNVKGILRKMGTFCYFLVMLFVPVVLHFFPLLLLLSKGFCLQTCAPVQSSISRNLEGSCIPMKFSE